MRVTHIDITRQNYYKFVIFVYKLSILKFRLSILFQLHRKLSERIDALSKAQMLAFCGHVWSRKPEYLEKTTDHGRLLHYHMSALGPEPESSSDKKETYYCTIQVTHLHYSSPIYGRPTLISAWLFPLLFKLTIILLPMYKNNAPF